MIVKKTNYSQSNEKSHFRFETTYKQIISLDKYMSLNKSVDEIKSTLETSKLKKGKKFDKEQTLRWLKNSWNTEKVMRLSEQLFDDSENTFALHWSFPQAYYSVFLSTLAFFRSVGYTETSHAGVMKKFGKLCSTKYPKHVNFYSYGNYKDIKIRNLNNRIMVDSIMVDSILDSVEQLLRTTRQRELEIYRNSPEVAKRFKTKKETIKKKLTSEDWKQISDVKPETTLLNYLYRKRINSNYHDIDTFTDERMGAEQIHKSLINIVNQINFVNEVFIYKVLKTEYQSFVLDFLGNGRGEFLRERYNLANQIFEDFKLPH